MFFKNGPVVLHINTKSLKLWRTKQFYQHTSKRWKMINVLRTISTLSYTEIAFYYLESWKLFVREGFHFKFSLQIEFPNWLYKTSIELFWLSFFIKSWTYGPIKTLIRICPLIWAAFTWQPLVWCITTVGQFWPTFTIMPRRANSAVVFMCVASIRTKHSCRTRYGVWCSTGAKEPSRAQSSIWSAGSPVTIKPCPANA